MNKQQTKIKFTAFPEHSAHKTFVNHGHCKK